MPSCCGGASCSCKIEAGGSIVVTGTGSPNDPFVVTADLNLDALDNETFDLTLTGNGTVLTPWGLEVDYAATARLTDLPDVAATAPAPGQVLGWNAAVGQWQPQDPTTAPTGAVTHGPSLQGDGSSAAPLAVVGNGARFVTTDANGVGLTDPGLNRMIRRFVNTVDRDSAGLPTPDLNTLSMLDSAPGRVDYWDGTVWSAVKPDYDQVLTGGEFLRLSGPWTTQRRTYLIKQVAATTDSGGLITLLSSTDLSGRAGIISLWFQETGALAVKVVPQAVGAIVKGNCYHLTDGALWPGQNIVGTLTAWLY